jgi:hypothetical protein
MLLAAQPCRQPRRFVHDHHRQTLLLPFLPLYVEQLGVSGHAAIAQWSGIAFGATFIAAALIALCVRCGRRQRRAPARVDLFSFLEFSRHVSYKIRQMTET